MNTIKIAKCYTPIKKFRIEDVCDHQTKEITQEPFHEYESMTIVAYDEMAIYEILGMYGVYFEGIEEGNNFKKECLFLEETPQQEETLFKGKLGKSISINFNLN